MVNIDHEVVQPFAPMVVLDLTTESGTRISWDALRSPGLEAVHLGLLCGTSSCARGVPIPAAMRNAGVPEPPPLRSAQHSIGLPNLSQHHQRRVDSANALYRLAIEILVLCHVHGIIMSSENPANGWLWAAFVALALEHSPAAAKILGQLQMVLFHACCHGSTRRRNTGWLSTPGVYDALSATCKNDQPYEPWGVKWQAGSWVFDISEKAQYPHLLARRATACLVQFLTKHRTLMTEYHRIVEIHADEPAPENSKQLPPHFTGVKKPEEDECTATRPLGEKVNGCKAILTVKMIPQNSVLRKAPRSTWQIFPNAELVPKA